MKIIWLLAAIPAAAFVLTALVRRYALAVQVLDVPNERSSHAAPIPRGGGLTIVIIVLLALPLLWFEEALPFRVLLALGAGGTAVAAVGWWDDRVDVPAHWRLLVHLLAAILVLLLASDGAPSSVLSIDYAWSLIGSTVLVLFIGWVLNLYNFMDGVDGIAAVEAVTVAGVGGLLLWWVGEHSWAVLNAVVALASLGFLAWNWPPAKIFMGDAGSGFLGFMLSAMAVFIWIETPLSLWPWLILLGVFIVDASLTLFRRALRRERLYEAHRNHAYQHAARHFGSHRPVTIAVLLINLLWLAPWAAAATLWPTWGILFVMVSWSPLVLLCMSFRAGLDGELCSKVAP